MKAHLRIALTALIVFLVLAKVMTPATLYASSNRQPPLTSPSGLTPTVLPQNSPRSANPLIFDHLTMADGLSEATVVAIAQDELGFMWFATQNGLDKYDGYHFTVYTHDPDSPTSMSDNNIRALYMDHGGILWIGTLNGGLNRLDRHTDTFTHYSNVEDNPATLSSNYVRTIQEDAKGQIWAGTQNGLNRLDPATGKITRYLHNADDPTSLNNNRVSSLAIDAAGVLWVGTGAGLCRFDELTSHFTCYQHNDIDPHSLNGTAVGGIYTDTSGVLWVGTDDGLNAFDTVHGTATHYVNDPLNPHTLSNNMVHTIYEDKAGGLWIGTFGGGLDYFDRSTQLFTTYRNEDNNPNSMSGDNIVAIDEDRSGILWIGTEAAELDFVAVAQHKFVPLLSAPSPIGIQETADGQLWVATFEDGLLQLDHNDHVVKTYQYNPADPNGLIGSNIYVLQLDKQGLLWIGTDGGLNRLDPATGIVTSPYAEASAAIGLTRSPVRSIMQDRAGRMWFGTQTGLYCLDPISSAFNCYHPDAANTIQGSAKTIQVIYEDESGLIWLGTSNGLFALNLATGSIQPYVNDPNNPSSLSENNVTVIQPGDKGTLWIGTWGGGLNHFDPATKTFSRFTRKNGLPDDLVLGILTDSQGRLWLSTSNGLAVYNPRTAAIRAYDRLDGLPHNDFDENAYFQDSHGEMFFGASNAVVAFYPQDIQDNSYRPPVVLTDFQLFNKPIPVGSDSPLKQQPNYVRDLTLDYSQSVFSFEFAALNFSASSKNQYAYKLEGVDPGWNYVGNRRLATYTNLDPGQYTFKVIAANNDGMWNSEGLSIHLTITPPWWRTEWAYAAYVLLGLALITGYIRYRTQAQARELAAQRRELARERQLRETVERADHSKDEERARIAREMHDGLSQTLAALRFRVQTWPVLLRADPTHLEPEFSDVGTVLDEAQKELRGVIFALRPTMLDEQGLQSAVILMADNLSKHYRVKVYPVISGSQQVISTELEHSLFRIIQELLHNAAHHAQADGIWLNLAIKQDHIDLEVRDNGLGFDLAAQEARLKDSHWGLVHLRERVALLTGTISIESLPGQGTTVKILLPTEGAV